MGDIRCGEIHVASWRALAGRGDFSTQTLAPERHAPRPASYASLHCLLFSPRFDGAGKYLHYNHAAIPAGEDVGDENPPATCSTVLYIQPERLDREHRLSLGRLFYQNHICILAISSWFEGQGTNWPVKPWIFFPETADAIEPRFQTPGTRPPPPQRALQEP